MRVLTIPPSQYMLGKHLTLLSYKALNTNPQYVSLGERQDSISHSGIAWAIPPSLFPQQVGCEHFTMAVPTASSILILKLLRAGYITEGGQDSGISY